MITAQLPPSPSTGAASPAEGYTRHPRPVPKRKMRVNVAMEGWLKKQASSGLFKSWQNRYFVLYENSREIRYYGNVVESVIGNLPLDERGSIPLEFIVDIQVPEVDNHGGKRFDVHTSKVGSHSYPRDSQGTAGGGRVSHARIYSFEAPTIHDRQEWVRHLRSMTGIGTSSGPTAGPPLLTTTTEGTLSAGRGMTSSYVQPQSAREFGRAVYSFSSSPSLEDGHRRTASAPTYGHSASIEEAKLSPPTGSSALGKPPIATTSADSPPDGGISARRRRRAEAGTSARSTDE